MSEEVKKAENLINKQEYKKALDLAKKQHRKGKIENYINILDLLIENNYLKALEEKGLYYLYYDENHDNNDYGEKYFDKYLKAQPRSINALSEKAMARSEKKDYKKAITYMSKALDSYDKFSESEKPRISKEEVWMGKIELLLKENSPDALNELNKFEKEHNENKKLILFKGIELSKNNQNEEALEYLNKSLTQERTVIAVNAKGNVLFNLKRFKEALECFDSCIQYEKDVDDLELLTNFNSKAAFSAIELEDYSEGVKYLNKTINMLNQYPRLPDNLEKIYRECSFEKDRLLRKENVKDKEFSKTRFLSSKVAIVVLILFIIGYFILTYGV